MEQSKFAIIIEIKKTCFNSFLAVIKQTSSPFKINFSIVKVIDNTNRQNVIYSEITDKLSDFKTENVQQTVRRTSESDFVRETTGRRPDRRRGEYTGNGRVSKKPRFVPR